MAAVTEEEVERVRDIVASVPAGKVTTYGDVAAAAGRAEEIAALFRQGKGDGNHAGRDWDHRCQF